MTISIIIRILSLYSWGYILRQAPGWAQLNFCPGVGRKALLSKGASCVALTAMAAA